MIVRASPDVIGCAAMNGHPRRTLARIALCCALAVALLLPALARAAFVTFDTGPVRPLAMSPDGTRLFAANSPDNRLEVFSLASGSPVHVASVEVGLEPVAVAARTDGEVWVVNHLSDSISVVDVAANPPRVVRTLLVGDEPRDVVFAGPDGNRAFVTTAHRGQNIGFDPQLTTEGIGRADVWVFDATSLGAALGGTPITVVTLFGDTPRALAVSPDGSTVYAAVFHSGNRTTTVTEQAVCDGFGASPCNVNGVTMPGGLPPPDTNATGVPAPETGLIVKYDPGSARWRDQLGRNWNNAVKFDLPDQDVFAIDANANPPVAGAAFASVGTILFNMAVNPSSGKVYVTNTEAKNEVRFEGPGVFGGSTGPATCTRRASA
jgi:YVTN family beta-propeller protein